MWGDTLERFVSSNHVSNADTDSSLFNFRRRYRASRAISAATAERLVLTTGAIRDPCPLDVDSQTALGDPFSFRDWISQHHQQIDSAGKMAVFDPAKHQLQASYDFRYTSCSDLTIYMCSNARIGDVLSSVL